MLGAEPIFTIQAELSAIMNLGCTPYGERRIIDITGGTVQGAKLNGRVLPGGADWQIVRSDGAADISAHYTIETETSGASWSAVTACGMVRPRCWSAWHKATASIPGSIISAPSCGSRRPTPRSTGSTAFWRWRAASAKPAACGSTSTR